MIDDQEIDALAKVLYREMWRVDGKPAPDDGGYERVKRAANGELDLSHCPAVYEEAVYLADLYQRQARAALAFMRKLKI